MRDPRCQERLNKYFVELFASHITYPIFLTVQPNFGWSGDATGSERVKKLARGLFYRHDQLYWGCPRPEYMKHKERFRGFAIIEKRNAGPHPHFILSCSTPEEQVWRSRFLLEVTDNVVKEPDDADFAQWRRDVRASIEARPWGSRRWKLRDSVLTEFAPKGTAMVRPVPSSWDLQRALGYLTKEWRYTFDQLADRKSVPVQDWALEWFELRDFFGPEPKRIARPYLTMADGSQVLDLDNFAWRVPGKGKLK